MSTTHALDRPRAPETGELIALPAVADPLAAELTRAVATILSAPPGYRRDALMRYGYGVRHRAWKERQRLYDAARDTGLLADQWTYLWGRQDAPEADEWLNTLQTNWQRYGALCDALDAARVCV